MTVPADARTIGLLDGTPGAAEARLVEVRTSLMTHNDEVAAANRRTFRDLLVLNVVSSPGAGKTALLERVAGALQGDLRAAVVVGDLETDNDARRIRAAGAPSVQIVTGTVCHLEAEMVARAVERLDLADLDLLAIENVGNLVCPAAWDLGEDLRLVLMSTVEGEDKPAKYPRVFKSADAVVLTKMDIAEAVGFDRERARAELARMAPGTPVFELSARTGAGVGALLDYLRDHCRRKRTATAPEAAAP